MIDRNDERLARFPQWVRDELALRDRVIAELQVALAAERESVPTHLPRVIINDSLRYHPHEPDPASLPIDTRIRWQAAGETSDYFEVHADDNDGDGIEIVGSEAFSVYPMAANRVVLKKGRL